MHNLFKGTGEKNPTPPQSKKKVKSVRKVKGKIGLKLRTHCKGCCGSIEDMLDRLCHISRDRGKRYFV
jgi:hypothetical protein